MTTAYSTPTHGAPAPLAAAMASPLGSQVFFFLNQLDHAFQAAMFEAMKPLGLDIRQYTALALVADGHAPSQHELATVLHLDPSQVVTLIKGLAGRGLVVREALPHDRRAKTLRLTDAGRDIYAQAHDRVMQVEETLLASLARRERHGLIRLMERSLPTV